MRDYKSGQERLQTRAGISNRGRDYESVQNICNQILFIPGKADETSFFDTDSFLYYKNTLYSYQSSAIRTTSKLQNPRFFENFNNILMYAGLFINVRYTEVPIVVSKNMKKV